MRVESGGLRAHCRLGAVRARLAGGEALTLAGMPRLGPREMLVEDHAASLVRGVRADVNRDLGRAATAEWLADRWTVVIATTHICEPVHAIGLRADG